MVSVSSHVTLQEAAERKSFAANVTFVLVSAPLFGFLVGVERVGVVGRLLARDQLVLRLAEAGHWD